MRKHFLILMLMALLPLAGFAADLDVSRFSAGNITFGDGALGAVSNTQGLTQGVDYTVTNDRFYTSDQGAGETLVNEGLVNNLAKANVGTYYIKVVGIGDYVGGVIYVSFHINGIEITAGDIAAIADQPYSGSAIEPEPAVNVGGKDLVKGTDYTVAWSNNTNVGAVATVTVTGKGNYSGEVAKNFNIVAKAFTAANITVTVTDNEVTYDGTNTQTATVVVADKVLGTLTADKDYTVAYGGGHQDVGSYSITVTGKGNYTAVDIVADKQLVIGKATVLATPKATRAYDGTANLPAVLNTSFEYSGFVDATTAANVIVGATEWESDANLKKDVKADYVLKVKAGKNFLSTASGNYTFIPMTGTFAITPKPVEIYADDQTVEYGADIDATAIIVENLSAAITGWATAKTGDLACIQRAVIAYVDGGKLKVKANDAATDADKKVLANYNVAYNKNGGAETFGTLTTTKANITISLNSNVKLTKEYDGQKAAIVEDVTDANNLTIIGNTVGTDKLDLSGLKATVVDNTGAVNAAPGYKVTLSGAAISANADKYTINYVTTYYKVTQKALKVSINTQSAKVGDAIATVIKKDFFTVEGLVAPDTKDDIWELDLLPGAKAGDNIAAVETDAWITLTVKAGKAAAAANYSITPGEDLGLLVIVPDAAIVLNRPAKLVYEADNTLDNADAVIKAAAATKYDADGAAAFNATLPNTLGSAAIASLTAPQAALYNAVMGAAKAAGDALTVDDVKAYNAKLPGAVKAGDNTKYAVTFGDFNMVAEKWYPIVLPFATSVKEVSLTFGYAIVNILNKDNTDDTKIAFKLHMGDIPANTPFVVKVSDDMNMNEAVFGLTPILQKAIEYSDAPEVADASGVKFIGSYSAKTDGFRANEAFFSVSAAKNDYYWGSDKNTTYMAPLAAYFQIPADSPARTIIFEEADGSTTAIEAVTSFNEAKKIEGWYTLNGMKLETAPTQKGIYIKDGKKVVLK